ncbi:MAG: sugar phosphate nucleotidyltransferase, partial [Candidatus Parvarchaeum sp.]
MPLQKVEKAIILAAGQGSRLRPFTNFVPKPFVPYKDKPLIYYHIQNAYSAGIKDIIVVSRKDEEAGGIFKYQNDYIRNLAEGLRQEGVKISIAYQE